MTAHFDPVLNAHYLWFQRRSITDRWALALRLLYRAACRSKDGEMERGTWIGLLLITTSIVGCDTGTDTETSELAAPGDVVCQTIDTRGEAVLVGDVLTNTRRTPLVGEASFMPGFVASGNRVAWCQNFGTLAVRDLHSGSTTFHPVDCDGIAANSAGEIVMTAGFDGGLEQFASLDALIAGQPLAAEIGFSGPQGGIAMTADVAYQVAIHPLEDGNALIGFDRETGDASVVVLENQDDMVAGISIFGDSLYLLTLGVLGASDVQELVRYDRATGAEISRQAIAFEGGAQGLVCRADPRGLPNAGPAGTKDPVFDSI